MPSHLSLLSKADCGYSTAEDMAGHSRAADMEEEEDMAAAEDMHHHLPAMAVADLADSRLDHPLVLLRVLILSE